eukprot:scpid71331/ scgid30068/ 
MFLHSHTTTRTCELQDEHPHSPISLPAQVQAWRMPQPSRRLKQWLKQTCFQQRQTRGKEIRVASNYSSTEQTTTVFLSLSFLQKYMIVVMKPATSTTQLQEENYFEGSRAKA